MEAKYFYTATVKPSTAVLDCFRAHFTYSPLSEKELLEQPVVIEFIIYPIFSKAEAPREEVSRSSIRI